MIEYRMVEESKFDVAVWKGTWDVWKEEILILGGD